MKTVNEWCAGGKGGSAQLGRRGKTSVQTSSNIFLKALTEGAVTTEDVAYSSILQLSFKMPTVSFGGGSPLGVPCMGAPLGLIEREKKQVRINIQKALEYLEGGNEVIPKSSPLQGMKAQSLQFLFVGEVIHTSYQSCS